MSRGTGGGWGVIQIIGSPRLMLTVSTFLASARAWEKYGWKPGNDKTFNFESSPDDPTDASCFKVALTISLSLRKPEMPKLTSSNLTSSATNRSSNMWMGGRGSTRFSRFRDSFRTYGGMFWREWMQPARRYETGSPEWVDEEPVAFPSWETLSGLAYSQWVGLSAPAILMASLLPKTK